MTLELHRAVDSVRDHLENQEATDLDEIKFRYQGIAFFTKKSEINGIPTLELRANLGRLFTTAENSSDRRTAVEMIFDERKKGNSNFSISRSSKVAFRAFTQINKVTQNHDYINAISITALDSLRQISPILSHLKTA